MKLICLASKVDGIERWIGSLKHLTANDIELLVWMYEPHFEAELKECRIPNRILAAANSGFPEVIKRFNPAQATMLGNPDEWFISTDIRDVVFQRSLDPFPEDASVVVTSENHIYDESNFFKPWLPKHPRIIASTVYNVGQLAMRGKVFADYIDFLKASPQAPSEQMQLAEFLLARDIEPYENPHWLCIHKRYDEFRITEDGTFINKSTGIPYSMVHGPGNTKVILDEALKRG